MTNESPVSNGQTNTEVSARCAQPRSQPNGPCEADRLPDRESDASDKSDAGHRTEETDRDQRGDRLQSVIEFCVEALCSMNAALSVSRQRLGVIAFGSGANNEVNHRDRPCVGRAGERPTKVKPSSDRRHKLRCAVALRQSIRRRVVPSRPQKRCPTRRESVERVRQREAAAPHRVFLER